MTCPECRRCKDAGCVFCTNCGCDVTQMPETCELCEESESKGYAYCVGCGRRLSAPMPANPGTLHNIAHFCGIIAMMIAAVLLTVSLIALFMRFGETFGNLYSTDVTFFIIFPFIIDLFTVTGTPLQAWFVLIAVAAVIAVVYTVFKTMVVNDRTGDVSGTPLYEIGALIGATTVAQFLIVFICGILGHSMDPDLPTEIWKLVFSLLNAAVYEELIVRVLLLGLPMLAIALLARRKDVPLWRYVTGGFGITPFALVFILISSVIFGMGHYEAWGWVKVVPATISGVAMGYIFVKYGLYASIAMHFAIDYMIAGSWIAGDLGILLVGLLVIVLVCAGAVLMARYTVHGGRYLRDVRSFDFWTGARKPEEPSEAVEESL